MAGHKSVEKAQKAALDHMNLAPLMDFDMRLGEGTGEAPFHKAPFDRTCTYRKLLQSMQRLGSAERSVPWSSLLCAFINFLHERFVSCITFFLRFFNLINRFLHELHWIPFLW